MQKTDKATKSYEKIHDIYCQKAEEKRGWGNDIYQQDINSTQQCLYRQSTDEKMQKMHVYIIHKNKKLVMW